MGPECIWTFNNRNIGMAVNSYILTYTESVLLKFTQVYNQGNHSYYEHVALKSNNQKVLQYI